MQLWILFSLETGSSVGYRLHVRIRCGIVLHNDCGTICACKHARK